MQLTLEEFTGFIETLKNQQAKEIRVAKALEEVLDGRFTSSFAVDLTHNYLRMLEKLCGDREEFLDWWLYENECGTKGMEMFDSDGAVIPTTTAEDAYKYLASLAT